ncbi:fimbrial protein [Paraburkholderia sp. Ac-20342]|uniref:fimbrial protein n=1 Tax=Paraburkholderia sp. Ac-20342 TaxID=2703889 RepID=UPI00197D8261|nr:fimbrial protein [Paraburkholderia sp. Ac-20342]MBN3848530.1 fimbrial protein [Paraburkholderia sp. Ac-20342]
MFNILDKADNVTGAVRAWLNPCVKAPIGFGAKAVALLVLLMAGNGSFAADLISITPNPPPTLNFPSIITMGRDNPNPYGPTVEQTFQVTLGQDVACNINRYIEIGSIPVTGTGSAEGVFKTGLSGIGVLLKMTRVLGGDVNDLKPLVSGSLGTLSDPGRNKGSYPIKISATLVPLKNGGAASGNVGSLPYIKLTLGAFGCMSGGPSVVQYLGSGTISGATTCSINPANAALSFQLQAVDSKDLPTIGSNAGGQARLLNVDCGDARPNMFATFTDSTNPGNRSDKLTLVDAEDDSTAKGVALQLVIATPDEGAKLISFGPDSSAAGTANQIHLVNTATRPGSSGYIFTIIARYVRTGTITPGRVNGLATYTMSYQ